MLFNELALSDEHEIEKILGIYFSAIKTQMNMAGNGNEMKWEVKNQCGENDSLDLFYGRCSNESLMNYYKAQWLIIIYYAKELNSHNQRKPTENQR